MPINKKRIKLVTWAGLWANLALAGLKIWAGIAGASQAVLADGIHSLSDLATDLAVLIGVKYWTEPADACHPHGHHRIETLVTAGIGLCLAGAAVGLGYNGITALKSPGAKTPCWIAFYAALLSIVVKEVLYQWTMAVGKKAKSSAVMANAWHHRSDAMSSVPAAVAVAVASFHPGWGFVDHLGAVVVSFFILQAAWKISKPALAKLVDHGAPAGTVELIRETAMNTPGVVDAHAVRTRYLGSGIQADMHIMVDPDIAVRQGHEIAEKVEARLLQEVEDLLDVIVHVEPAPNETKD